jgi:hypothetical protein
MTIFKARDGRARSYEDWWLEAYNFYNDIDPSGKIVKMPHDWWRRWVVVLGIEKMEVNK